MRNYALHILILLLVALPPVVHAEPDRDSLIEAWEAHIASLPGTQSFESKGDGLYSIEDTDLPYQGDLRLIGALLRPVESAGFETGFSQFGMVEFELTDLPPERQGSQSYYYWIADRQTLHFSDEQQQWLSPQAYQQAITEMYQPDMSFGPLSFMLNYGIWILLVALIIFVFAAVKRQTGKARSLMDESSDINKRARENLDRGEAMQKEVLEISRSSQELHRETNRLLSEILTKLPQ